MKGAGAGKRSGPCRSVWRRRREVGAEQSGDKPSTFLCGLVVSIEESDSREG